MKITFSCLGFSTSDVFLEEVNKEFPGQYHIGYIFDRTYFDYDFEYFGIFLEKLKDFLPTKEEILKEYQTQYKKKGVWINDGIIYAG